MSNSYPVSPLYPVFSGLDGKPLEAGFLYLGQPGQNPETAELQVFWDEDLTIPAAQPIRTIAGFPSRNGSPAAVFAPGDFSITVKDRNSQLVYTSTSGAFPSWIYYALSAYSGWSGQTFDADGRTGLYPVNYMPEDHSSVLLMVDGIAQEYNRDYIFEAMEAAPSGWGLRIIADPVFTAPVRLRLLYTRQAYTSVFDGKTVSMTRAEMVTRLTEGFIPTAGVSYLLDGLLFIGSSDATDIPDLPGLIPAGEIYQEHFGPAGATSINDAMAYAIANSERVHFPSSATIRIPTDAATLQAACNAVSVGEGATVTLQIQTGHALNLPLSLSNGDWSRIAITSVDATVPLTANFSGDVIAGVNAHMPRLDCIIDATNQISGNGVDLEAGSMFITSNGGVRNAWGSGLAARYSADVTYDGADFSGAARSGGQNSNATIWGSVGSSEGLTATGSNWYGAQVSHGGIGAFRNSDLSGASRYGFRATDAGFADLESSDVSGAGIEGLRVFNGSGVNAPGLLASGAGDKAASVTNASFAHIGNDGSRDSDLTNATNYGIYASQGALVDASEAQAWGAGINGVFSGAASIVCAVDVNARINGETGADTFSDFVVHRGGVISLSTNSLGGVSQQPNTVLPNGVIYDPRPWTVPVISVAANQNNYNLSPELRNVVVLSPTGARNITGLAGGFSGARLTIVNASAANRLQMKNQDAGSTAENRFSLPHGSEFVIYPGCSATFVYVTDRWYLASATGAPQLPEPRTVATLPDAAQHERARFYVTDANATTLGDIVAGGGSNIVPVFSDGTNWRLG